MILVKSEMLSLRFANISDAERLYIWRNDSEVRKNSFNEEFIPFENHVEWFSKTLKRNDVLFYILLRNEEPIGQIRINIDDGVGIISYSIDGDYRNCGFGKKILALVQEKIKEDNSLVTELCGLVKLNNVASQKAFEKLGYKKIESEFIEYRKKL